MASNSFCVVCKFASRAFRIAIVRVAEKSRTLEMEGAGKNVGKTAQNKKNRCLTGTGQPRLHWEIKTKTPLENKDQDSIGTFEVNFCYFLFFCVCMCVVCLAVLYTLLRNHFLLTKIPVRNFSRIQIGNWSSSNCVRGVVEISNVRRRRSFKFEKRRKGGSHLGFVSKGAFGT